MSHAMAQVVCCQSAAIEAWVQSYASPCVIWCGQTCIGTGFSPMYLSFPPITIIPPRLHTHSFICHWHYINLEIGMCRITPTLMIYFCIVIICVDCILHVCFECGFESYKKTWSCTDDPLWEIKPTSAYVYWKYSAALVMLSSVSCFWSTECFTQRWPQINNCRPWKHNFGSTHLRRSGKCRSCWKSLCRDMPDTQDAYFLWMEDCS